MPALRRHARLPRDAFAWNLAPATLGNLIGGGVLVTLLFWYTFGSDPKRREALRRADELARTAD